MADWINYMNFEKEVLPCFNDSASNIAPTISSLFDYLSDLNIGFELIKNRKDYFVFLEQSGYVVSKKSNFKMILDVGSSWIIFQLMVMQTHFLSNYLLTERVLVNSGTSTYEVSQRRTFERSTKLIILLKSMSKIHQKFGLPLEREKEQKFLIKLKKSRRNKRFMFS